MLHHSRSAVCVLTMVQLLNLAQCLITRLVMASLPLFHSFRQDSRPTTLDQQSPVQSSYEQHSDTILDPPKRFPVPEQHSLSPPSRLQALSNIAKEAVATVKQTSQDLVAGGQNLTKSTIKSEWEYDEFITHKPKFDIESLIVGLMIHLDTPSSGRQYAAAEISRILKHRNRSAWKNLTFQCVLQQYALLEQNQRDPKNPFGGWRLKGSAEQRLRSLQIHSKYARLSSRRR